MGNSRGSDSRKHPQRPRTQASLIGSDCGTVLRSQRLRNGPHFHLHRIDLNPENVYSDFSGILRHLAHIERTICLAWVRSDSIRRNSAFWASVMTPNGSRKHEDNGLQAFNARFHAAGAATHPDLSRIPLLLLAVGEWLALTAGTPARSPGTQRQRPFCLVWFHTITFRSASLRFSMAGTPPKPATPAAAQHKHSYSHGFRVASPESDGERHRRPSSNRGSAHVDIDALFPSRAGSATTDSSGFDYAAASAVNIMAVLQNPRVRRR